MENLENIDLTKFISLYKEQWAEIRHREQYKWVAIKHFQEHKSDLSKNLSYETLKNAMSKTRNLLDSGNYLPKKMLLLNTEHQSSIMKRAWDSLFNENNNLASRISDYRAEFQNAIDQNIKIGKINKNKQKHFQDERAISVYLTLMYPEKYYFYKYSIYKAFCTKFNLDIPHRSSNESTSNLTNYYEVCDKVKEQLKQDKDLINLYKRTLLEEGGYEDPSLNLLVQDFLYTFSKDFYLQTQKELEYTIEVFKAEDLITQEKDNIEFNKEGQLDYRKRQDENTTIGTLGEQYVIQQEIHRLSQYKRKLTPYYIANKNDFAGYDIMSYNQDGSVRYIEVKTTSYAVDTPFYISDREIAFSIKHANNYYLYRVYDFDRQKNTGKIKIIKGSLEKLATNPIKYKIVFKQK